MRWAEVLSYSTMRNGIRQILRRDFGTQIEVHDADFARYEEGATLVVMK